MKQKILNISKRISACIYETKEFSDDVYYAKIWYSYIYNNVDHSDGTKEFIADNESDLLKKIKDHMQIVETKDLFKITLS